MMLFIIFVASVFSSVGVAATSALDNFVMDAQAVFISVGSVIAAGLSPCGPVIAASRFLDAVQNASNWGLFVTAVFGCESDDWLEPQHEAKSMRKAKTIPDERVFIYFIPKNLPNLLRRPVRERGIPVARETLRFAAVTPRARFHEKVSPGPSFMSLTVPAGHAEVSGIVVVGGTPR